ncbi:vitamin K epoxide reductase family protein [Flavobacterium sp.]|uniref:vitamin K epoxide reductase family protein n=1 Tax=Flavobacterium sp. TaxID=239 RepID=UPI0026017EC3|nr:vitamin K epoxide reductase family protein [Flavobacterium sp.]
MKPSVAGLVNRHLKLSNYHIEPKTLDMQLQTHPDFPTFKAVSDTYDYFGIRNLAARIPFAAIRQLPENFIALLKSNGDLEAFLVQRRKSGFLITNQNMERQKLSADAFETIWEGTTILIDENKRTVSGAGVFEKTAFIAMAAFAVFSLISVNSIPFIAYHLLSLSGLALSYYILKESFGFHSKTTAKVCATISKQDGCGVVINDQNAKLFKWISLSDAVLVYFLSITLSAILIGANDAVFLTLAALSIPVVLYSIYYQGIVVRKWCALCLGISGILMVQFVLACMHWPAMAPSIAYASKFLFIVLFVSLSWYKLKGVLSERFRLESVEFEFTRFRRDQELFLMCLTKEHLKDHNVIAKSHKITFGSDKPVIVIDAVTNPMCGFCSEAFKTYAGLLKTYGEKVQINLIFSVPNKNTTHPATQIVMAVLAMYLSGDKTQSLHMLASWFEKRDLKDWLNQYPVQQDARITAILNDHHDWVASNGVTQIPTTFINNYLFPKRYDLSDIFLFIDDLISENSH